MKHSFFEAFFLRSAWNDWAKAVKECLIGNCANRFTPYEKKKEGEVKELGKWSEIAKKIDNEIPEKNDVFPVYKSKQDLSVSNYKITCEDRIEAARRLNEISSISELWAAEGVERCKGTQRSIFRDAVAVAKDLTILTRQTIPTSYLSSPDKSYEVLTCVYEKNIYGIAMLEPSEDSSLICLDTLATDPRNIQSDVCENGVIPQIKGVGSTLMYAIFQKCLKENKGLELTSHQSAINFYKRFGLTEKEGCVGSYQPEMAISIDKIRQFMDDHPFPS